MHDRTETTCVLAATFADVESAREASKELRSAGFDDLWIGVAKRDGGSEAYGAEATDAVEADNWMQRTFGGEGDERLRDALIRHGVSEAEAAKAGALDAGGAVLTVAGENHPEEAAQIFNRRGGRLISGGYGSAGYDASATAEPFDVSSDAQGDYGRFREGEAIDGARRMQLREERLRLQRERVSAGEVRIRKAVVASEQAFDVPVAHEELIITRTPVNRAVADMDDAAGADGAADVIRVPLSAERVTLEKETFVTEEVEIGKRSVEENERLTGVTRKETLEVASDGAERARRDA